MTATATRAEGAPPAVDPLTAPCTRRDLLAVLATVAEHAPTAELRMAFGLAWEHLTVEWRRPAA